MKVYTLPIIGMSLLVNEQVYVMYKECTKHYHITFCKEYGIQKYVQYITNYGISLFVRSMVYKNMYNTLPIMVYHFLLGVWYTKICTIHYQLWYITFC